ncbi:hypothetical protein PUN28_002141 [Cardiocondyla obscurior]|uniref:Ubiquitin-like protease family profile domain-containing protein n=1 Tax=Cardiocondyla obscurior TaxID=286306 RepID=A0AAW2GSV9_9HYME
MCNNTYDSLAAKEKNYIRLRYPTVRQCNIIFEKVDVQPDAISCGIYAAAFATTVALGDNPCNIKYSKNVKCMRQHFMTVIEGNELLPFPIRNKKPETPIQMILFLIRMRYICFATTLVI